MYVYGKGKTKAEMEKIKELIIKKKSVIAYLIFGVLTTLVNIVVYTVLADRCSLSTVMSSTIACIVAVIFAYITNRKWVFESKNENILKEFGSFILCRTGTGVLDVAIMYISVDLLMLNGTVMKIISNVLVIIINYVASRFIFAKK